MEWLSDRQAPRGLDKGLTEQGWYVAYTKPRQESVAECNLQRQSFETYLPWIFQARRKRGERKGIVEPMFPCYLFYNGLI